MKKKYNWLELEDRFEMRVGQYELHVFKSMFKSLRGSEPTIYTNHSGKRLIREGLDREAVAKMKTFDEAKQALIERFKKIVTEEMRDHKDFLQEHP